MDSEHSVSDILIRELEYRRKKQWDIFSWCSTLLVAITGGIIALQKGPSGISNGQKFSISLAVVLLAAYAIPWIGHNYKLEVAAIAEMGQQGNFLKHKNPIFGSRVAVGFLALAALFAAWNPWS